MNKANTEELCEKTYKRANELYGENLPSFVFERIEWEIRSMND